MRSLAFGGLLCALIVCAGCPSKSTGIMVVNMTPNWRSNETNQDSEPFLSIHSTAPGIMIGSAFTPDPGGGSLAPVYVTLSSGDAWDLSMIVPSAGAMGGTGDITHAHAGQNGRLYAGILRLPGSLLLNILRSPSGFATMTPLVSRNNVDQPFVQASTAVLGERIYVANNDLGAGSQTATVDYSLDGGATWNIARIEARATFTPNGQNGPSVRPTVARDGTVYVAFFGWRAFNWNTFVATSDIVVVRDDNGAAGANPFTDLTDGTGVQGRIVVTNRTIPWSNAPTLGQERIGSTLTIAVDPNNSATVYVAWCDRINNGSAYTAHVRRSTNRGQTWSGDLRTLPNTTCISLAVADNGTVGFLYQQVTNPGQPNARWQTILEQTRDAFTNRNTTVLATVPANAPAPIFLPYIGDYNFLTSVNNEFRGIFSTNNTPDNANFPNGVTYHRNANFTTRTLTDQQGNAVAISIDPFYFRVPAIQ